MTYSIMKHLGMATHFLQPGDHNTAHIKLHIICSDGIEYDGNPVYLHSHVLKKSKFFEAKLSERWSCDISSFPEIKLSIPPNASVQNYIKCIRLMYSSHSGACLSFSGVDETLEILPLYSELLFDEGIQACMQYLEAVPWTPQQKLKIEPLLSSLQVSISADLSARLGIPESSLTEDLELLKKRLPLMFSMVCKVDSGIIPVGHMRNTLKQYIVKKFHSNAPPAIQSICRDTLLNGCRLEIEGIKDGRSCETRESACETLSWLLELIKLSTTEIFETAFKMFVEDSQLSNKLAGPPRHLSSKASHHLLDILINRYLDALAKGYLITTKPLRVSFLRTWVPGMAYHILQMPYNGRVMYASYLECSDRLVEGVTKVVGGLPPDDQKGVFNFWADAALNKFQANEREAFRWWIHVIWLAVTDETSYCLI